MKTKHILAFVALVILILGISIVLPPETRPAPASASDPVTKCPPPTSEGAYFERGIGKDGNVICGFSYYNECPYASGYSADDPMCDKFKQQQEPAPALAPVQQATEPTNKCEGK